MKAKVAILSAALLALCLSGAAWALPVCERTPQVRDAIIREAGVGSCGDVDAKALKGILRLNLSCPHPPCPAVLSLKAGDFDGLKTLDELDLFRRGLTALPAGVFDRLDSLRLLWLGANRLKVQARAFDELASLETISLRWNRLTALPVGVFDGLNSLLHIDIHGNRLTALPAGIFDGLHSLQSLWLQDNRLKALPAEIFDGLASLEELYMNNNRLTVLPAGIFDGLASLQELPLYSNRLTELPAGVFDELHSLLWLDLSHNRLTGLPAGIFDGLSGRIFVGGNCLGLPADHFERRESGHIFGLNDGPYGQEDVRACEPRFWRGWRLMLLRENLGR